MTAIFKRELKSYLTSMVGYLFIFFVLVLTRSEEHTSELQSQR